MQHVYEEVVGAFLCRNHRFLCPKYSIKSDGEIGDWRCSDFVVLDLEEKRVIIAEVTAAADLGNFVLKAAELHDKGREKVRKQLGAGFQGYPKISHLALGIHLVWREDPGGEFRRD